MDHITVANGDEISLYRATNDKLEKVAWVKSRCADESLLYKWSMATAVVVDTAKVPSWGYEPVDTPPVTEKKKKRTYKRETRKRLPMAEKYQYRDDPTNIYYPPDQVNKVEFTRERVGPVIKLVMTDDEFTVGALIDLAHVRFRDIHGARTSKDYTHRAIRDSLKRYERVGLITRQNNGVTWRKIRYLVTPKGQQKLGLLDGDQEVRDIGPAQHDMDDRWSL